MSQTSIIPTEPHDVTFQMALLLSVHLQAPKFQNKREHLIRNKDAGKVTAFWDVTPCSLVHRNQCFSRTCCPNLRSKKKVFENDVADSYNTPF
jgi:hypothetical protein